ncbi:MAG: hypothetical protein AB7O59_23935 [Pirellulales bacterium]
MNLWRIDVREFQAGRSRDPQGNFRSESLAVGYRRPNRRGLAAPRVFSILPSSPWQID